MQQKTYLIIPAMPTPNGGLHLGHVGGPYLSADILTRHLRMHGHAVTLASGIDCYESFVELQAQEEQRSYQEICQHYYQQIQSDFNSMQIEFDYFINPLDETHHHAYQQKHLDVVAQLNQQNKLIYQSERIPQSLQGKYLVGCWLEGQCPNCRSNMTAYCCDACGAYLSPEQVILNDTHTAAIVKNIFVSMPSKVKLPTTLGSRYRQQIQQHSLLRLSTHSNWGIAISTQQVLFSYGFIYAYYHLLGDLAQQQHAMAQHPFHSDSSTTTFATFGIDNAIPAITSVLGLSSHLKQKAIDHYLINYFYHLDEAKFSTSRRHAIWVKDIINDCNANSDIVRLYLASIDIQTQHRSFSTTLFLDFYSTWIERIKTIIIPSIAKLTSPKYMLDAKLLNEFNNSYPDLAFDDFKPHHGVIAIEKWLLLFNQHAMQPYWWLKLFAILAYPYMPTLSTAIWHCLGFENHPSCINIDFAPTHHVSHEITLNLTQLTTHDIQCCIQGAL